jgi:hypothetical protein
MKTIFDCETEIARCDAQKLAPEVRPNAEDPVTLCAHTRAYLNGTRGVLKIEQRCFLRAGNEIPDQPWVKPELLLEPALDSEKEMVQLIRKTHEQYIGRVLAEYPAHYPY